MDAVADQPPPRRQRVAAYGLVCRDDKILVTLLDSEIQPNLWVLPGGGIDHGEHPRDAVIREVYEETGLRVRAGRLREVLSRHFTGPRPDGLVEDFHSMGLIFDVELLPESVGVTPRVVEVDGSTRDCAWVPLEEVEALSLGWSVQLGLSLLRPDVSGAGS